MSKMWSCADSQRLCTCKGEATDSQAPLLALSSALDAEMQRSERPATHQITDEETSHPSRRSIQGIT